MILDISGEIIRKFKYYHQDNILLSRIDPLLGLKNKQTTVSATTKKILHLKNISCRFGIKKVKAMFLSETQILCQSPINSADVINFTISNNGEECVASSLVCLHYDQVKINLLLPKHR